MGAQQPQDLQAHHHHRQAPRRGGRPHAGHALIAAAPGPGLGPAGALGPAERLPVHISLRGGRHRRQGGVRALPGPGHRGHGLQGRPQRGDALLPPQPGRRIGRARLLLHLRGGGALELRAPRGAASHHGGPGGLHPWAPGGPRGGRLPLRVRREQARCKVPYLQGRDPPHEPGRDGETRRGVRPRAVCQTWRVRARHGGHHPEHPRHPGAARPVGQDQPVTEGDIHARGAALRGPIHGEPPLGHAGHTRLLLGGRRVGAPLPAGGQVPGDREARERVESPPGHHQGPLRDALQRDARQARDQPRGDCDRSHPPRVPLPDHGAHAGAALWVSAGGFRSWRLWSGTPWCWPARGRAGAGDGGRWVSDHEAKACGGLAMVDGCTHARRCHVMGPDRA
mmetsp:Transcript_19902/g.66935  ORF Transcript_19902/g.66935 Transcript_19902/m.66935 type:complete len:395 (+) Transcript_19902:498-1682(+)